MNLLICDDNSIELKKTSDLVRKWSALNKIDIAIFETDDVEVALKSAVMTDYAIALLDIEMPQMDGMDVTDVLRKNNPDILVIFISNYESYVCDAFSLKVFSYVYKRNLEKQLPKILDDAVKEISNEKTFFKYKIQREEYIININRIRYFEAIGHHIVMYTKNESIEFVGAIRDLEERLNNQIFVRVNRQNIVNIKYIEEIKQNNIILEGNELIPIGKKYADNIKKQRMIWYSKRN